MLGDGKEIRPEDFEDENLRAQWTNIISMKAQLSQQIANIENNLSR